MGFAFWIDYNTEAKFSPCKFLIETLHVLTLSPRKHFLKNVLNFLKGLKKKL